MLFTQLIQANLTTQQLGRNIEHFPVTESTNTEAKELATEGAQEGTVVTADNQTAGRGRHGQSWFCGAGKGLVFSVILRPNIRGRSSGLIPLLTGVAVVEALEEFNLKPALKWPNDILLNKKKCGGILMEGKFQGELLISVVIGIGLNVNERLNELPSELLATSTSVAEETGTTVQRELLLASILNNLEPWYHSLQSGATTDIISAWEDYCAHLHKGVSFLRKGQEMTGTFSGVAEDGEAIIESRDDRLLLSSEEINVLREEK